MKFNFKDCLHNKKHDFIKFAKVQKLEFAIYSVKLIFN